MKLNEVYGEYIVPITCSKNELGNTIKIAILMSLNEYKVSVDLSNTPTNEHAIYGQLLKYKLEGTVRSHFRAESTRNVNEFTAIFTTGLNFAVSGLLNRQVAKKYFDLIKDHLIQEINGLAFTRRELNWNDVPAIMNYWCIDKHGVAKLSTLEPIPNIKTGGFEFPKNAVVQLANDQGFWGDWTKSVIKRGYSKLEYMDAKYTEQNKLKSKIA